MPQKVQACQILDPGQSLRIKGLCGNPNWEEEFWETFQRKHKQVFGDVKEIVHLDDNNMEDEEVPKIELCSVDEDVCHSSPPDALQQNKDLHLKRPKPLKRGATDNIRMHLWHSRKLVSAVKQGRSYLQILQEQEEEKNEKRRKTKARRHTDLHHPTSISNTKIENEEERRSGKGGVSRRQGHQLRPFTPVYQSLTSDQPQQLSEEHVYRQLCCLCWLLEMLTLERSGKCLPVASCWDSKDPGQSRNTLKAVSREKLIQAKWERFVSPPKPLRPVNRLSRTTCQTRSAMSSSVFTNSLLGNVSSCDVTFSTEGSVCPSMVMSETDPPISKYLQKLLDEVHQSISKELYGSTTDCSSETDRISFETLRAQYNTQDSVVTGKLESHTPKSLERSLASTVLSLEKAAMLEEIKLMFKERAQELALSLTDMLDLKARKMWMSGVQRYQSLSNMSNSSQCRTSSGLWFNPNLHMQDSGTPEPPYSTKWLSTLLSSLPAHIHSNRKLVCVLEKLNRYTQERTLRIRPHVFFKVLNSLHPWELCYPELCVAIEIVRKNAVRMSTDEYDCWLRGKVDIPQSL